jgi:asparagine synthetase B (glutamine-hydrolysing)
VLESLLKVANVYWENDAFCPSLPIGDLSELRRMLCGVEGQFALALAADERVILVRDKQGVNKLFFAVRTDGTVVAANYIIHLRQIGIPFEAIYSVPAGHFVVVGARQKRLATVRYWESAIGTQTASSLGELARSIRAALEQWFSRLAREFGDWHIFLCLSGGVDSSLIGSLACKYFEKVAAFTYCFSEKGHCQSEDAICAGRMAQYLRIPLHVVPATSDDILSSLQDALVYGQDWRDFNVHCAVVNDLLARAMSKHPGKRLVLTGDQMNEIVADYTPVRYGGRDYYKLPNVDFDQLRTILIRGLDAGDREVGVFHRHGLDLLQPYGLVVDEYCRVPGEHLRGEGGKRRLVKEVADDLVPSFIQERKKVRAQIGTSGEPTGILPVLLEAGRDARWLREAWRRLHDVDDARHMDRFIRAGVYRMATVFPSEVRGEYLSD